MARYVVYEKSSTLILFWKYGSPRTFATLGAAKAALTREIKNRIKKNEAYANRGDRYMSTPEEAINRDDYAIAEAREFYDRIEKKHTVKNLLSGKEFTEGVNTPGYLSPSRESYWSM